MEEQNQNLRGDGSTSRSDSMPKMTERPKRSKLWKFAAWFVVVIIVAVAGLWAIGDYEKKRDIKAFEEWAESTKRSFEEFEARKAADTYGGATPQETLRMYIEAVERGDYELASKYFVLGKQNFWLNELENISRADKLNEFLDPIKLVNFSSGEYSNDQESFSIYEPVGVDFVRYPSGVWKLEEI